jgi:hypothetical protein
LYTPTDIGYNRGTGMPIERSMTPGEAQKRIEELREEIRWVRSRGRRGTGMGGQSDGHRDSKVKRLHWDWLGIGEPRCAPRKYRYWAYALAGTSAEVTCKDCLRYIGRER